MDKASCICLTKHEIVQDFDLTETCFLITWGAVIENKRNLRNYNAWKKQVVYV